MSAPPEHADLLAAVADELMLVREGIDGIEALVSDLVRRAPLEERPNALDRKSTRLNSSHTDISRMPSYA